MGTSHIDPVRDKVGVYYKYKTTEYRSKCEGCGRGYHSHRWQAHHVLPGVVFGGLDHFINQCLGVTDYNINETYSMAGMPTLKAFILYFQSDPDFPKPDLARDKLVQLKRWGTIQPYQYQASIPVTYPGDIPCHQPVSFGHVKYNEDVDEYLKTKIWNALMKKKKENSHFEPVDVKSKLMKAQKHFWDDLVSRASPGIKDSFKNRYGSTQSTWWKPMCMADVASAPTSPSLA